MIERITGPDGLPFYLPVGQNIVADELRAGKQWEPYLSCLWPLACREDTWTVEVGAWSGEHTIELLRYGPVLAYEPQDVPFACLTLNLASRERTPRWKTYRYAVYDHRQPLALDPVDGYVDHPSQHFLPAHQTNGLVTVHLDSHLAPISSWHPKGVGFLKIDAQGADLAVLHGAESLIARYHPIILCEFYADLALKHGHVAMDYIEWFTTHGYQYRAFSGGNIIAVHKSRPIEPFVDALSAQGVTWES